MTAELEPVAWVIPGNDNVSDYGFFDAMAWQEGEFSLPLVTVSSAQEAIDKREERIRELERERDVWKAKSGGIAVQPVLESLHAAEARASALQALLDEVGVRLPEAHGQAE